MRLETHAQELTAAEMRAGYQAAHARLMGAPPVQPKPEPMPVPVVAVARARLVILAIGDDDYARLLRAWTGAGKPIPTLVRIEDIQRIVARYYNVSRGDMISARRTINVVRPRQIAMYLAKTLTLRSLPEIGRRFGGRDHTTVLHAVRKIGERMCVDSALATEIAVLIVACGGLPE